ncbi:MAG: SNF2-related protein [Polyangiaceae bacterium]
MPAQLQPLFEAVRKACLPGPWSQGTKLAREGAVLAASTSDDSITVRVRATAQGIAPTVTLYPGDEEWACDCEGPVDPCAHVAAAAIALHQAASKGAELVSADAAFGKLRYRLSSRQAVLVVERSIVRGDREEPFTGSLAQAPAGLTPTREDLAIDRIVTLRRGGLVPLERVRELFDPLSSVDDVRLGDEKVRVDREVIGPRAYVVDHGDGVMLLVDRDPRVREAVAPGVVRCGDVLHPMSDVDLTGVMLDRLPLRRAFSRSDLGKLVTQVLPEMEKKIPVEIQSRRLPRAKTGMKPRIAFDLRQRDHTLSITASLVYGDPPEAVVQEGRLVQLAKHTPIRDEAAERALVSRLREELHLIPGRRVDFDGADAVRFAQKLLAWDDSDGSARARLLGRGTLVARMRIDDDLFDLSFDLVEGFDTNATPDGASGPEEGSAPSSSRTPRGADPAAVLRAWQEGLPLVPLLGGGWAPLPVDWLSRFGSRVADLLAARRDDGKIERAALPALAELCDALDQPRPRSFERLAPVLEGFDRIPEAELPADLTATLRPYQLAGVSWLTFLRDTGLGAVLADDMGLGKTLQALCAVRGRTLVVCPKSVVFNWVDEIRKFRPGLRAAIYHGPKRSLDREADVVITTYAVLRLDEEQLAKEEWSCVFLDEAQAIKNPDSQIARAAYNVRGDFRVALSGTPVENRLEELWSLLHFTNRGLLGGRRDFDERWSRPIANGTQGAAEALRRKVRPFVLRRIKREVTPELPPRTDQVLYCGFEDAELKIYDAVKAATRNEVVKSSPRARAVLAALEALLRLRQAACHSALVPGQTATTSSKVERLLESLEEAAADGHKSLVFSQWTSFLDLVDRTSAKPASIRAPRRLHARPRRRRRRVPERERPPRDAPQPQGRRHRPQPLPPTTSTCSTRGGTPPSKIRPPTAPTASARTSPTRCTASSQRTPSRGILACKSASVPRRRRPREADRAAALTREDLLALLQ